MTTLAISRQTTIDCLDEAISSLMALRVVLGGIPGDAPFSASDRALAADEGFQQAKLDAQRAWRRIIEEVGCSRVCLDAEAATNHMAAEACRVGWQLAMVVVAGGLEERGGGAEAPGSSR